MTSQEDPRAPLERADSDLMEFHSQLVEVLGGDYSASVDTVRYWQPGRREYLRFAAEVLEGLRPDVADGVYDAAGLWTPSSEAGGAAQSAPRSAGS